MIMRDLDELLPQVMPLAPSCPEVIALRYLREAARQYCQVMPVWRDTDSFTITAEQYEQLSSLPDVEIVKIETAHLDETKLEPVAVGDLDQKHPNWFNSTDEGSARYVTQIGPDSVSLYPRAAGTLTMRLVLKPSLQARTVPEVLVTRYADIIGRGAAGNILLLPNTEFANPALGSAHLAFFNSKINVGAQLRARSGQQRAPLRTKARFV